MDMRIYLDPKLSLLKKIEKELLHKPSKKQLKTQKLKDIMEFVKSYDRIK